MTAPTYGTLHRGRVIAAGETTNSYLVEVPAIAPDRAFGPVPSTVAALASGDRILLAQVGTTQGDLVIIGKVPPVAVVTLPIGITDVTGLSAALDDRATDAELASLTSIVAGKQPLDSDLTAIAALAPADGSVLARVAGAWNSRTAAQLKADLAITQSDVSGLTSALAGKQPLDADLTAIAGLSPSNDDVAQYKAGAWTNRTPAQLKTDLAIAQADVSGLVTALAGKQPLDSDLTTFAGLTPANDDVAQYKAGAWANRTLAQLKTDLSLQPLDSDLTDIAALAPANDDVIQRKSGAWTNRTLAQLKTDLSVQPLDSDLTAIAGLSPAADDIIQFKSGAWTNRTMAQLRTDLNPPRAQLRQTVAQSLTSGAFASLLFDTEDKDVGNAHSTVSNTSRWVFPATGDAWVSGAACFASSAGFKAVRWALSGTVVSGSQVDSSSITGVQWSMNAKGMWISGTSGQYIELQAYQETGSSLNTGVISDVQSTMSVWFIG
jgi:hypothetical protein